MSGERSGRQVWIEDTRSRLLVGDEIGRACSQPRCKREAVFVLMRSVYTASKGTVPRRWYCCDLPDHCYGRRVVDGLVLTRTWHWDDEF